MDLRLRRGSARALAAALTACCLAGLAGAAHAGPRDTSLSAESSDAIPGPTGERPATPTRPPGGYRLSARRAIAVAEGDPKVQRLFQRHPTARPDATTKGPGRWQVSYFAGRRELAQVVVDDRAERVLESWAGPQVAWLMARGYEGAFGRKINAPYVWLSLCALFFGAFFDRRRPFRLAHLDLLALLAFGVSHFFFNRAEIGVSVPLVYPVLAYLLARMLWIGLRGSRVRLRPAVPVAYLAVAALFLVGFRVGLNLTDSNVIDVGYSGVIGADRIADGEAVYGGFPTDNHAGDTYGPAAYYAYVPFEQAMPWSGRWDELPAAHAAAIFFDLATMLGLWLVGRRLRPGEAGSSLGVVLAFAWAAYPYTGFVLASNANDSLVAMLLVYAFLALGSAPVRGALLALAAATKFAPLALAPLFTGPFRASAQRGGRGLASVVAFGVAFLAVTVAVMAQTLVDPGLARFWERTVGFQAGRDSPFSLWGQAGGLEWLQTAVKAAAVALALAAAWLARGRGAHQVAALGAAVLLALQLTAEHWFYLYVVWFFPFVLIALAAGDEKRPA